MRLFIAVFIILSSIGCHSINTIKERRLINSIAAPAGNRYCQIDQEGTTILPNGRLVRPSGKTYRIAPHPFGLTLSKDGTIAVTANSGNRPFSITIIRRPFSVQPEIIQVPEGAQNNSNVLEDVFMGLAITSDNKYVWVAGGISNTIYQFDLTTGLKVDSINCAQADNPDGYLGDLCLNSDESKLYVCDQSNFEVLTISTKIKSVIARTKVGRYPFGLCLAPNEDRLYVANVGMFAYSPLEPLNGLDLTKAPDFATIPFGSDSMYYGFETGDYKVPALGDPNAPESFSVWTLDVTLDQPKVIRKIKTGFLVGEKIDGIPAVGGSSPNSIVCSEKYVYVTNGNNDCISIIDAENGKIAKQLRLNLFPPLRNKRGIIPFGIALAPSKNKMYVAAAGINAVAEIDVKTAKVTGYLPVGWFPSKLAVSPDGDKLIVANAKGFGSGPNGGEGFTEGPEGTYIGHLMKGSITVLPIPDKNELKKYTDQVIDNNFSQSKRKCNPPNPITLRDSPIKHLVFISKENRTYDEVFGQVASGKGDPQLARYGYNRSFSNKAETSKVQGATVMPNHLALAARFAISDNFYVDSDHSADGHRWLACTYPNEWLETSIAADYGGHRNGKPGSKAIGQYAWTGGAGAIFPEDYNEAGALWDHLNRHQIDFFNFGFGTEMASNIADSTMKYTGQKVLVNFPIPAPLYNRTSRKYATYNMAIPDQFRADMFIEEFSEKWLEGNQKMPSLITIMLPQDHGAGERPHAGYPFRESYMADNDLALGRIVEFLSHTPYWKEMAIIVTEDDAQDGQDHVDAHRSLLMVISPWAKQGFVSHDHTSFGSIFKTIWNVLKIPSLNQYDAAATDLRDAFTMEPNFSPYKAIPADPGILNPATLLRPFDKKFDWKSLLDSPTLDNVEDFLIEKRKPYERNR